MEDSAVLDVRASADSDGVDVSSNDGVHPDADVISKGDIADDLSGEVDIAVCGNSGRDSLIGTEHEGNSIGLRGAITWEPNTDAGMGPV